MSATPLPRIVHSLADAREAISAARRRGLRTGLVPTMGALHAGHLSLAAAARRECDFTAVTIFVNPTQFAPHEDFSKYPRTLDADVRLLAQENVDLVFAPSADDMYPAGADTLVVPGAVAAPWEGAFRPTHFRGVATIVLKLFNVLPADVAFFGQKDYQQSLVIRRMVADLNVPIEIRVCPIIREPDGLAMSSRNQYLSADERQRALALSRSLRQVESSFRAGKTDAGQLRAEMQAVLAATPGINVDYATIVDPQTLQEVAAAAPGSVALIAARVGATRLIDNLIL